MTEQELLAIRSMVRKNLSKSFPGPIPSSTTFSEALDIGMGMPVSTLLKGGNASVAIPAAIRGLLMDAYRDGSAADFGEFMRSALPAASQEVNNFLRQSKRADRMKKLGRLFLFTVVTPYGATIGPATLYFNWQYIKEHTLVDWVMGGQIVSTVKAAVWPYFVF